MIGRDPSENVRTVAVLVLPFVLVFGVYVIAHGHYGPGGGFAGGVILAVGVVLLRITLGAELGNRRFPPALANWALAFGMALFLASALLPLGFGGSLLDYAAVPAGDVSASERRYLGIMVVEFAVGSVVFGGILMLFDQLVRARTTP